ncbi:MAG: response regulator [Chitinivibrionales bacterium]|nr:response regulator [Chitinivibrionales bacterium]
MNYLGKRKNRNILIVDDEVDVLELLKIYLESQNWEVSIVNSAQQALDFLQKKPFFLILTDIAMPEMDGYEFINKLSEMNITSQIALMTGFGYNPKHTLVKINKKCRYPIFFKPFEFKKPKLAETIRSAWEKYHEDIPE